MLHTGNSGIKTVEIEKPHFLKNIFHEKLAIRITLIIKPAKPGTKANVTNLSFFGTPLTVITVPLFTSIHPRHNFHSVYIGLVSFFFNKIEYVLT